MAFVDLLDLKYRQAKSRFNTGNFIDKFSYKD